MPSHGNQISPMLIRVLLVLIAAFGQHASACELPGYDEELAENEAEIRTLTAQPAAAPHRLLRLAHALYAKASLTTDYVDFRAADNAIIAAHEAGEPAAECSYLRASFDFKLHRLTAASTTLEQLAHLAQVPEIAVLRADVLLQQGHVAAASALYDQLSAGSSTWDVTARIAWLKSHQGEPQEADRLYASAQEELTAKEMRSWAWLELQRGLLDLETGRFAEALAHFQKADRAYPGYWLIQEHIAEVFDKLGRTDEASALYRRIIARTGNPEFVSSLAAIEQRANPEAAAALYKKARFLFEQQRQQYPEAAIGHFLEHLIDLPGDPDPELLSMAEENRRLRPSLDAMLLKTRVCLRLHDTATARSLVTAALAAGWRTAELDALDKSLH